VADHHNGGWLTLSKAVKGKLVSLKELHEVPPRALVSLWRVRARLEAGLVVLPRRFPDAG
jgi:hypothetical protein